MRNAPKARRKGTSTPEGNGRLDSLGFIRASLQSVQTNIFVADPTLTIIFANDRALQTLRGMEEEIRKAFGVAVDDIVGGSIHRFHKDPQAVERILRSARALPHRADFTFGSITLQ